MEFTLSILDYQLNRIYKTEHRGTWNHRLILRQILLWDNRGGQEDTLYLLPPFLNVECAPSSRDLVLYIFEENSAVLRDTPGYFLFCPQGCLVEAVNRSLNLLGEFQSWVWSLKELASTSRNLQKLLDLSGAYLHTGLIIVDNEFQYVAYSDQGYSSFPQILLPEKGRMDLEEIQQLYLDDRDFDQTYTKTGLVFYPVQSDEYRIYYYNVYYRQQYLARLLLAIPISADCPGARLLMEYLGKTLASCYQYYYETKLADTRSAGLYEIFRSLLEGKTFDRERASRTLLASGWQTSHSYQILKFQPESHSSSSLSLDYFCIQIETTFSETIAIQLGHSIFCIRNLSCAQEDSSFRSNLAYFLRESLCRAGLSNIFTDFFQCSLYAGESSEALILGAQIDPTFWYYNFSDYTLEYMLTKSTELYPAAELCHPAVNVLRDYDQSHPGSALTETLHQYLAQGLNASKAAESLHIHRTTFLYRMKKIQQLYPLREDDLKEKVRLELSFLLCPDKI